MIRQVIKLKWLKWREARVAAALERSRRWQTWVESPEGCEYIEQYGTEDWESLH